jgi:hypothetical protein
VLLDGDRHGQVALDVGDGAGQHPQPVSQAVEVRPGDDDLPFIEPPLSGPLARLVVALATALPAVLARPARPVPVGQGSLAPSAAPVFAVPLLGPGVIDFRHVTKG